MVFTVFTRKVGDCPWRFVSLLQGNWLSLIDVCQKYPKVIVEGLLEYFFQRRQVPISFKKSKGWVCSSPRPLEGLRIYADDTWNSVPLKWGGSKMTMIRGLQLKRHNSRTDRVDPFGAQKHSGENIEDGLLCVDLPGKTSHFQRYNGKGPDRKG